MDTRLRYYLPLLAATVLQGAASAPTPAIHPEPRQLGVIATKLKHTDDALPTVTHLADSSKPRKPLSKLALIVLIVIVVVVVLLIVVALCCMFSFRNKRRSKKSRRGEDDDEDEDEDEEEEARRSDRHEEEPHVRVVDERVVSQPQTAAANQSSNPPDGYDYDEPSLHAYPPQSPAPVYNDPYNYDQPSYPSETYRPQQPTASEPYDRQQGGQGDRVPLLWQ